jgi:hypothetical protein
LTFTVVAIALSMAARLLAALLALAAASAAAAAVAGPTVSVWPGTATSSLGVAGSPSARTLFISYYSNWQYNLSTNSYPAIFNSNYNMLRECHVRSQHLAARLTHRHLRRDLQPDLQHRVAGQLQHPVPPERPGAGGGRRGLELGQ